MISPTPFLGVPVSTQLAELDRLSDTFEDQFAKANLLVKVALEGLRRSSHVLDLTSQLRFAALNVFVKSERSNESSNVFAPISAEFMILVRDYERLTQDFGEQSSEFVNLMVSYMKDLRCQQQIVRALVLLVVSQEGISKEEGIDFLRRFFASKLRSFRLHGVERSDLAFYHARYRDYCANLARVWDGIRKGFHALRRTDRELANVSNLGAYTAQLARIEASRLEGREDLVAAFDNISLLLGRCLEELKFMRSWFSQGLGIIDSLNWEISEL